MGEKHWHQSYRLKDKMRELWGGTGRLHRFLSFERKGYERGDLVFLRTLPNSKKQVVLEEFAKAYYDFLFAHQNARFERHPYRFEQEALQKVNMEIDRMGDVVGFTVPKQWIQLVR